MTQSEMLIEVIMKNEISPYGIWHLLKNVSSAQYRNIEKNGGEYFILSDGSCFYLNDVKSIVNKIGSY